MFSLRRSIIITLASSLAVDAAPAVEVRAEAPATFKANPAIGPGGNTFIDSPHFRVYDAQEKKAKDALNMLEGAYSCYVEKLGWRSSGLAFNAASDNGPWTKVNIYTVNDLGTAAGVMHSDFEAGMSYLEVIDSALADPRVTVHEYGHGLTYHAKTWVDQTRTGAWWETVAQWFADTYKTSPLCEEARNKFGQSATETMIDVRKVIGDSFQVLVDGSAESGNYYEAWPFLSYLTYNPDKFAGFGTNTMRESFVQYKEGSNEDPLHTFARLSTNATIQEVVGRYWARMAFVDIGHPTAQSVFLEQRRDINFANLDSQANGVYKVKSARQPKYMGANIIPLKDTKAGKVTAKISTTSSYTATLSIRNTDSGATRYVDFKSGSASASISSAEEAAVVVANTPELILYDGLKLSAEVSKGLDYTLTLTGASA